MTAFAPSLDQKYAASIHPGQIGASTAVNGTGVDTKGWSHALAIVAYGDTAAAATAEPKVQESDDNSTWSDISGAVTTAENGDDDVAFGIAVPLGGARKRYLRIVVHQSSATDDVHGFFILSNGVESPNTAAEAGFSELIYV